VYGLSGKAPIVIVSYINSQILRKRVVGLQIMDDDLLPGGDHLALFDLISNAPMQDLTGEAINDRQDVSVALMRSDPLKLDVHLQHSQRLGWVYLPVFGVRPGRLLWAFNQQLTFLHEAVHFLAIDN